jgi:hypothetical protein
MMKSLCATLLLSSFLIAGCGGDADDAADTATVDTASTPAATNEPSTPAATELKGCGLITEAEASTALGVPVQYRSNDGSDNCIVEEKTQPGLSIDFQLHPDASTYDYHSKMKDVQTISGLGEQAVFHGSGTMGQIAVLKNGKTLSGTISDMSKKTTDLRAKAEAFARVIVDKM